MIRNREARDIIEKLHINPFIDGPTQALVKATAKLIFQVPEFKYIFGDNIDTYERVDYSERALPALRVYNFTYRKEQESHYINGDLLLDVIFPASLRRDELQYFQDILCAALLQQFRRPTFFAEMRELVPGLNELGKVFSVNKENGMRVEDGYVPITQNTVNFRIDLKIWDDYLESTARTKDDPFNVTLKDLKTIAVQILPIRDDNSPDSNAQTGATINIEGE